MKIILPHRPVPAGVSTQAEIPVLCLPAELRMRSGTRDLTVCDDLLIGAYLHRSLLKMLQRRTEYELRKHLARISSEEAAVLVLLQQRMERELKSS